MKNLTTLYQYESYILLIFITVDILDEF